MSSSGTIVVVRSWAQVGVPSCIDRHDDPPGTRAATTCANVTTGARADWGAVSGPVIARAAEGLSMGERNSMSTFA
ncbi:MAG: hypothetical protein JJU19_16325 [Pararhodobacter sp.]|nr:hypothetical protein [Pararhodobacter sp.]